VRPWPPITEPELVERLELDDEAFLLFIEGLARELPRRELTPEAYQRALSYPWERPAGSYVLRGDRIEALSDLTPAGRRSTLAAFTADRHPIVSFGANGAPSALRTKFAHFPEPSDQEALVLTGYLRDVDVGAIAAPGIMGYMAGTLFASPGTAVRAAVVWLTPAQATQLAWSELSYRLGRLEDARFEMDEADVAVEDVFAFVSRFGAFCVDGRPVALAAVPAKGRTAVALSQEELLDTVAQMLLGPEARAEDLMRAAFEDMADVYTRGARLRESSQPLLSAWTPFGGGAGPA
jgi:hypothetical protein